MSKTRKKLIINILVGIVIVACVLTFYSTFSLDNDYVFESDVYDIDGGYIKNVSSNTSVELYYKYFDLDNCSIEVVDEDNKEIVSDFVVNGSKTVLYDSNGNAIASYINIIKGDYNGDGIIDMNDFYDMGKCLVDSCGLEEYLLKSVDIDEDGELHINDLVLLDKAVTLGYTGIEIVDNEMLLQSNESGRLVANVMPGYGVNLNVKWSSTDSNVATVDDAGIVTGHVEGSTVIKATTLDGKYVDEAVVTVDNTIQLVSYNGIGYVGGNDVVVWIKSVDYEGIICSVSNEEYASCAIEDENLVIVPKAVGNTVVTVTSPKYGQVSYSLDVQSIYLNVMPRYLCTTPGNAHLITVSSFNSGDLSFEAADNEIITDAYMTNYNGRKMLRIDFGIKQGRTTLKVTESRGNTSNIVTVDVTSIEMADIGKVATIGEEVSTTILGDNLGELSCVSSNEELGTCRIEDNKLIVTTFGLGMITVDVYNKFSYNNQLYDCGSAQFLVVVQEG